MKRGQVAVAILLAVAVLTGTGFRLERLKAPHRMGGRPSFPGVPIPGNPPAPALPPVGSDAVVALTATNINGSDNAGLSHGDPVLTWINIGTGADAVAVDSSFSLAANNAPHAKIGASPTMLAFDGVNDFLEIASTDTAIACIHQTGIFDIVVVATRLQPGLTLFLGNSGSTAHYGFWLEIFDTSGHVAIGVTRGVAGVPNMVGYLSSTFTMLPGVKKKIHARGTGTSLEISDDFVTYDTIPFVNAPSGSNPATYLLQVAAYGSDAVSGYDFGEVFVYCRGSNLNAAEITQLNDYILAKDGI